MTGPVGAEVVGPDPNGAAPWCPTCGAIMRFIPVGAGKTEKAFWGCSQYPDCRGSRQIEEEADRRTDEEWYNSNGGKDE